MSVNFASGHWVNHFSLFVVFPILFRVLSFWDFHLCNILKHRTHKFVAASLFRHWEINVDSLSVTVQSSIFWGHSAYKKHQTQIGSPDFKNCNLLAVEFEAKESNCIRQLSNALHFVPVYMYANSENSKTFVILNTAFFRRRR